MKQYAVRKSAFTCLLMLAALSAEVAFAQSTAFTYQGRLEDNGVPANDDFAFVVRLFDDADTGVQLGPTVCEDAVDVVNGLFTLSLDFGFQFDSGQQFLDIQVLREGDCADTSGFEQLSPRQQVTATPMALRALEAEVAEGAGLAEHAGFADLAAAANRLDAPDGSPTSAVFVDNAGNVGIGTQTPLSPLHVSAPNPILTLRDSDNNDSSQSGFLNFTNSSNIGRAQIGLTGQNGDLRFVNSSATGNMTFAAGTGINRLTLTANGQVGIGTGVPTSNLEIRGGDNSGPGSIATLRLVDNSFNQMLFDGNEIEGTEGLFLNHNTAQNVILATGGGNVGIGTSTPTSKLDVNGTMVIVKEGDQAELLWFGTERSWVFKQEGTGIATALKLESIGGGGNKNFFIQTTGGVGIGRNPTANQLEVAGSASKTTAGSWLANSDAAIKTNVRTISNALGVIARLRPVAFRYTELYQAKHPSVKDQDYYNYIAQEFREVFPESVKDSGEEGLLQMDEYPAGVYAVAAIQELHAMVQDKNCKIDDLVERERSKDHRLGELEGRNAELQARVARLEALLEARTSPQQAD